MCVCVCAHAHDYTHLYVCVYFCCLGVCASLKRITPRQSSWCIDTVASSTIVLRLMALFPGSSHLPTLLLFVAFRSWEKQRQLVGSTANPQGQAVSLQKRVEYTYSTREQTRGSHPRHLPGLPEERHPSRQVAPKHPRIKPELKGHSWPPWNLGGFREGA